MANQANTRSRSLLQKLIFDQLVKSRSMGVGWSCTTYGIEAGFIQDFDTKF
jgi:hypothetical protein